MIKLGRGDKIFLSIAAGVLTLCSVALHALGGWSAVVGAWIGALIVVIPVVGISLLYTRRHGA